MTGLAAVVPLAARLAEPPPPVPTALDNLHQLERYQPSTDEARKVRRVAIRQCARFLADATEAS